MNKLPKKILKMKGLTMKQKWALHRKGGKATKRSTGGSVKKAKAYVKKQWGAGRILNAARMVDVISRPAQGKFFNPSIGFTKKGAEEAANAYSCGFYKHGKYTKGSGESLYGGMASGLIVNYAKGKAGVYRGMGKNKILSWIMGLSPEIMAMTKADPIDEFEEWNSWRSVADSGYNSKYNKFTLLDSPNSPHTDLFWADKALNVGLGLIQKLVFNTNGLLKLNKYFPKDVNF